MSPFLFVLCIERLCHINEEAVSDRMWVGIQVAQNGPVLSHLPFANDMILLFKAFVE